MLVIRALVVVDVNRVGRYSKVAPNSTRRLVFGLRFGRLLLREYSSNMNLIANFFG
jgi:hypothetical protein